MTVHDQQLLDDAERHVYAVGEHPDDWFGIDSWERYEYIWEPLPDLAFVPPF